MEIQIPMFLVVSVFDGSHTDNPDGTPDLGQCGNTGNAGSDNIGSGGHTVADHRKAIEEAKYTYELLPALKDAYVKCRF